MHCMRIFTGRYAKQGLKVDNCEQIYHVDLKQAAWFSAVPWCVMGFMGYFGGVWSDKLIRSGISVTLTRKIMQVSPFFL